MKAAKFFFATVVIVITTIALPQRVTAQTQNQQAYIDMQARAEREVIPNEIYLTITIKESDYKGKKTLQEMQNAMIGVLKSNKIDIQEALSINYMGSTVSYKLFSSRVTPKSNAKYMLKLNDTETMQKVICDLEEKEISNIELTKTKYTKEEELITELGIEAMKKAQSQARALAGAVDQEIGKALTISSWSSHSAPQPRMYKARNMAMVEESAADITDDSNSIPVGKLTYQVNVNVRFELK